MSIAALLTVFNEEKRIEYTLKTLKWCDEIWVLDKSSTDKTIEIVKKYTKNIISIESREYVPNEGIIFFDYVKTDWVIMLVASDIIHPRLAFEIRKLVDDPSFFYDVILVPYKRYIMGIDSKYSPWFTKFFPSVMKRNVVEFDSSRVHGSVYARSARTFKLNYLPKDCCLYHLSHESPDSSLERIGRYCRAEAKVSIAERSLLVELKPVIKAIAIIFKRRTFLLGWDGISLGFLYLAYYMLRFIYIWYHKRQDFNEYDNIRKDILQAWTPFLSNIERTGKERRIDENI